MWKYILLFLIFNLLIGKLRVIYKFKSAYVEIVTSQIQLCFVNGYEVPEFLYILCLILLYNYGGIHSCASYLISL